MKYLFDRFERTKNYFKHTVYNTAKAPLRFYYMNCLFLLVFFEKPIPRWMQKMFEDEIKSDPFPSKVERYER